MMSRQVPGLAIPGTAKPKTRRSNVSEWEEIRGAQTADFEAIFGRKKTIWYLFN